MLASHVTSNAFVDCASIVVCDIDRQIRQVVVLSWYKNGTIIVLSWYYHATIMVPSWYYHATIMVPSWYHHGTIMVLSWYYHIISYQDTNRSSGCHHNHQDGSGDLAPCKNRTTNNTIQFIIEQNGTKQNKTKQNNRAE